ncbi:hypothetical protein [Pleomorphomonas sp. PLEO]|uniref:hypothetical protein n=1 Tax=Pleomorphomonas sp. PLEO TaxID=3239306 RepID=UPI00351DFE35
MSSISLSKPQRVTAAMPQRMAGERKIDHVQTESAGDQDRSAAANNALSPGLFWKAIMALATVLVINATIGMALHGTFWLTAYWDALAYSCESSLSLSVR